MAHTRPIASEPELSQVLRTAPATAPPVNSAERDRLLLAAYTLTIFLNAGLLFLVQPMFTRMVLPLFGGSAAVWTTCMLFFQAALLAGYFYAYIAPRWLGLRRQALVHIGLLLLSLFTLPLTVKTSAGAAAAGHPAGALLLLLTLSLGAPFFLLSSGSPLLQKWFSRTGHATAANPYFLYAASNLGSMLALIGYPFLLEPRFRLADQSKLWMALYVVLVVFTAICVSLMRRPLSAAGRVLDDAAGESAASRPSLGWALRLKWVVLAFVPSSLLLGVTTFLTTDIAPVPLLWVVPLALYLLTFVIVFARRQFVSQHALLRVQPYLLLPLIVNIAVGMTAWPAVLLPVHLAAFVVAALICHGQLAATRPRVEHLTEFYLWVSVGGMLGGVFNVIIAPLLFSTLAEYPVALVLAALLRPAEKTSTPHTRRMDVAWPLALGIGMYLLQSFFPATRGGAALVVAGCVAAVLVFSFSRRPLRFALGMTALLLAGSLATHDANRLLMVRSFFGVHRVERDPAGYHLLSHGSTIHGAQSLSAQRRLEPLSYYHRAGPVGQLFAALPTRPQRSVAVIGLGTGTITCYGRSGERWTYYELDAVVERIARDRRFFTWLSDCPVAPAVVLGDARLNLTPAPAGSYDLIVIDAFTSDAIPIHLMTRDAVALYLDKLAPGGAIVVNISNRYLDLQPVFARIARELQLVGRYQYHDPGKDQQRQHLESSVWLVLARNEADLGPIAGDRRWWSLAESPRVRLWTDDFSNILSVFKWH